MKTDDKDIYNKLEIIYEAMGAYYKDFFQKPNTIRLNQLTFNELITLDMIFNSSYQVSSIFGMRIKIDNTLSPNECLLFNDGLNKIEKLLIKLAQKSNSPQKTSEDEPIEEVKK